jgi:SAM-dependent methyltransferase
MRIRPFVRALYRGHRPVRLGSLASTQPVSSSWGFDRGLPVDRWYIERFLQQHRRDVTGRVLEVKDSMYTDRFGHGVEARAVLDIHPGNEQATHVADLAQAESVPSNAFDCFVLTQTLQYIFDVPAALAHAHRILRPGGVLLTTVPVTSKVSEPPLTDLWRFTPMAMERLLEEAFGRGAVSVSGSGNVLTQVASLTGLAAEDLTAAELDVDDERFPLIVCARAVRSM